MPSFLPAGSIGKELLNISDAKLYKLNDQINKGQEGGPSEGAVNLAHALFLPLTIPELKHLWIIEDDYLTAFADRFLVVSKESIMTPQGGRGGSRGFRRRPAGDCRRHTNRLGHPP